MTDPENFEEIELVSPDGKVMVNLEYIGEGFSGEFEPGDDGHDDPSALGSDESDDLPLLRCTLYRRYDEGMDEDKVTEVCETDEYEDGDWMQVLRGSYCTHLSAWDQRPLLQEAAKYILDRVHPGLLNMKREKQLYEQLSWISIADGKVVCPE